MDNHDNAEDGCLMAIDRVVHKSRVRVTGGTSRNIAICHMVTAKTCKSALIPMPVDSRPDFPLEPNATGPAGLGSNRLEDRGGRDRQECDNPIYPRQTHPGQRRAR